MDRVKKIFHYICVGENNYQLHSSSIWPCPFRVSLHNLSCTAIISFITNVISSLVRNFLCLSFVSMQQYKSFETKYQMCQTLCGLLILLQGMKPICSPTFLSYAICNENSSPLPLYVVSTNSVKCNIHS